MKFSYPTKIALFAAIFAAFAGSNSIIAQSGAKPARPTIASNDPGNWALIYSAVLDSNRGKLGGYTWQSRVSVTDKSELLYVDLLQARYGNDGNLQLTLINKGLQVKQRHGLLRAPGQENRLAEVEAKVEMVKNSVLSYVYMSRGSVVDFFDRSQKTAAPGYDGAIRVDGRDVLKKGDSVTVVGDRATGSPITLSFITPIDDKTSVSAVVHFRYLRSNDAFISSQVDAKVIETPKIGKPKTVSVAVETFDFMKQL